MSFLPRRDKNDIQQVESDWHTKVLTLCRLFSPRRAKIIYIKKGSTMLPQATICDLQFEQEETMSTLIKGGTIVTASETYQADVLIEGEQVVTIGHGIAGDTTIDASGKYVIPGGIDVHTHLDMPFGGTMSSDNFFTGHKAAAFG